MDPATFQLEGADGQLHDYEVTPHMTSEGTNLMLRVMATAAEPLSRLASAYLETKDEVSLDDDLSDALATLDLSQIGSDVKAALLGLDSEILREFFARTRRDGESLTKVTAYDEAYQGNWAEWMQALKEIIRINGFIPFLSSLAKS